MYDQTEEQKSLLPAHCDSTWPSEGSDEPLGLDCGHDVECDERTNHNPEAWPLHAKMADVRSDGLLSDSDIDSDTSMSSVQSDGLSVHADSSDDSSSDSSRSSSEARLDDVFSARYLRSLEAANVKMLLPLSAAGQSNGSIKNDVVLKVEPTDGACDKTLAEPRVRRSFLCRVLGKVVKQCVCFEF
jgi:hypothetical protein